MKILLRILLAVVIVMTFAVTVMATEETENPEPTLAAYANDMSYYLGGYGAMTNRYRCDVDYREQGYSFGEWFDISFGDPLVANWPVEAGTYTVTFEKITKIPGAGDTEYTFPVSMNITVLELPETSGKCGDDMEWDFDVKTGTLTISGYGEMYTIAQNTEAFWSGEYEYEPGWWKLPVKHIVVEETVKRLSDFAFFQGWNKYYEVHETIQLPATMNEFPKLGFLTSSAMTTLVIPEGVTSLTGWPFGSPGNSFMSLTELYLPSTLTEMDALTICFSGMDPENMPGLSLKTIYFGGTEQQWNEIQLVQSDVYASIFGSEDEANAWYDEWSAMFQDAFAKVEVICAPSEDEKEEEEEEEVPTSGQLGENITWSYDAETETMTLSGTGATANPVDETWVNLFMYKLKPKHIVVEEGITHLTPGIFHYGLSVESLTLPTTLQEIPDALIGWNGIDGLILDGNVVHTMLAIVIPEGITSLTNSAFYLCSGISDYYLPSTLTEIDLDTLCYVAYSRIGMELAALDTTIHYAGTQEQWEQVKHVTGSRTFPTGLSDAELEELFATFTVVFEPKKITIENGTATVPDNMLEITEGENVIIDVTDTEETVGSVVLGGGAVDKLAGAQTSVAIKLPDVTVSFDAEAVGAIGQQAGQTDITIVAKKVTDNALTAEQKAALVEKEVLTYLSLEAHAGETQITEFGGGKVTVSVSFALPEGKTGSDFYVAHVADDGVVTEMLTTYRDGFLTFETTHFSNYVVLEKVTAPEPDDTNPPTGDNSCLGLLAAAMLLGVASVALCTTKRRVF